MSLALLMTAACVPRGPADPTTCSAAATAPSASGSTGGATAAADGRPWSDPATWRALGTTKPVAGAAVTIPAGANVLLDETPPALGCLVVAGTLDFEEKDLGLTAGWIMVHAGGSLKIGRPTAPFTHRATITLSGADVGQDVMGMGTRGLFVHGGRLELFGAAPSPAWTRLGNHAAAGTRSLTLAQNTNWKAGDNLVVAPTDFYRVGGTEAVAVTSASGATVQLGAPLGQARWGTLQHVTPSGLSETRPAAGAVVPPGAGTPEVLDERAEVGNLSRAIVIQSVDDQLWSQEGFGAHVVVMDRASAVTIDGVELRRMGQRGRTGRYPVHFHLLSYDSSGRELGDFPGVVRNSAIRDSENRCLVIHASNGVTLDNNICYDVAGHSIFLEDAVERRNLIRGNLTLHNRRSSQPLMDHEDENHQGGPAASGSPTRTTR